MTETAAVLAALWCSGLVLQAWAMAELSAANRERPLRSNAHLLPPRRPLTSSALLAAGTASLMGAVSWEGASASTWALVGWVVLGVVAPSLLVQGAVLARHDRQLDRQVAGGLTADAA